MAKEPRSLADSEAYVVTLGRAFEAAEHFRWALFHAESFIGEVMLLKRGPEDSLEVGIWLDRDATGTGLAAEAAQAAVSEAWRIGTQRLRMVCDVENTASNRLPRAMGAALLRTEPADNNVTLNIWELRRP